MAIKVGLVGLPNVGKSTLFNALTKSSIPAENYPFCTVDPHVAITYVPDERLTKLAGIFNSAKIIPNTVQFVDIAGLVKGASTGEGLGNQFLSNIMEVDLVLHVLRCFEDSDITHVHDTVNPLDDFETIVTELMLKDLESIAKREVKVEGVLKSAKTKGLSAHEIASYEKEKDFYDRVTQALHKGNTDDVYTITKEADAQDVHHIPLLSAKKFLVIANLSEDDLSANAYTENKLYQKIVSSFGEDKVIPVSAKIESELAQVSDEEALELMSSLEITHKGLDAIIKKSYEALGLISFFTCGPKEAHAWSVRRNTKVPAAAGTIHSDMERGFICAEVYHCDDLFDLKTEAALKSAGKVRTEGKEYVVQDGDLLLIRFNV